MDLASELVERQEFFKPITIEEIVIFMMTLIIKRQFPFARLITSARASSVSPSSASYTKTIITQSARVLSQDYFFKHHCRISYGRGLGMSPCIMELTTEDPSILKDHIELYKIIKFRLNWANTEQDIAIQSSKIW